MLVTAEGVLGTLFAIVTVGGGVLVIAMRERIAGWNARVNRKTFGAFGDRVAKNSTPSWIVIIGVGLILLGVVSLLRVIFPGQG